MISMNIIKKTRKWAVFCIFISLILGAWAYGNYQGLEEGYSIINYNYLLETQAPLRGIFSICAGTLIGILCITMYLEYKIENSPHAIVKKLKLALNEDDPEDEEVEIK